MLSNQDKKQIVEESLKLGMIRIFVNPSVPDIHLPTYLLATPNIVLNLSHRFANPIELKDDAIYTVLSFDSKDFPVRIPWKSIWLVSNTNVRNQYIFYEDAPAISKSEIIPKDTFNLKGIKGEGEVTPPKKGHLKLLN